MNVEHYKVVSSTQIEKLEEAIEGLLADGWQPLDGVSPVPTIGGGSIMWIQTMVKPA